MTVPSQHHDVLCWDELPSLPDGIELLAAMVAQARACMRDRASSMTEYQESQLVMVFHVRHHRSQDLFHLHAVYPASFYRAVPEHSDFAPAVCVDAHGLLRQLQSASGVAPTMRPLRVDELHAEVHPKTAHAAKREVRRLGALLDSEGSGHGTTSSSRRHWSGTARVLVRSSLRSTRRSWLCT